MNDIFLAVLPLKTTRKATIKNVLASWLDDVDDNNNDHQHNNGVGGNHKLKPEFRSVECIKDLENLESMRDDICRLIPSETTTTSTETSADNNNNNNNSDDINTLYDTIIPSLPTLYEYYAVLKEFEQKNIATIDEGTSTATPSLSLSWTSSVGSCSSSESGTTLSHQISNLSLASAVSYQTNSTLTWERANILYNIASLEAYQASKQPLNSRPSWKKAGLHLEKSANMVKYMRNHIVEGEERTAGAGTGTEQPIDAAAAEQIVPFSNSCIDFSASFLLAWESMLTADAQKAAYRAFGCSARPMHLMLAKLAAAGAVLFQKCEELCNENELVTQTPDISNIWRDRAKAWGMYMKCRSEYHQACTHKEKKQWSHEYTRLNFASEEGDRCLRFLNLRQNNKNILPEQEEPSESELENNNSSSTKSSSANTKSLIQQLNETIQNLQDRLVQSRNKLVEESITEIPRYDDLTEITPQMQVNLKKPITNLLPPPKTQWFQDIMNPLARRYVNLFTTEMKNKVEQMAQIADEKTESAKMALATVNLPHSVTAYNQEQSGGGLPDELWTRIVAVQKQGRIHYIQQALWELKDIAEAAESTYKHIESQLKENLLMDELFRDQYPTFDGHDASQVQMAFTNSLKNYSRLLKEASEGDQHLLLRLKKLDTDPKYKMLQFHRSQLDLLLPGIAGGGSKSISTVPLSKKLNELTAIFEERTLFIKQLHDAVKNYDIYSKVAKVDIASPNAEKELQRALVESSESFDTVAYSVTNNVNIQGELLRSILSENQKFMLAREEQMQSRIGSGNDSCIVKMENAIEEIEQLSKHLRDGKHFYDKIFPKLGKLKNQVGDLSTRLAVQRLECEEKARQSQQEEEDAKMAASFDSSHHDNNNNNNNNDSQHNNDLTQDNNNSNRNYDDTKTLSSAEKAASNHNNNNNISNRDGNNYRHFVLDSLAGSEGNYQSGQPQPGFEQVSHDKPMVRIDDEKVASLISMDFDPEKVVAALKKCDNNMEHALNELLSV